MSTGRRWPAGVHPVWTANPPPPRVKKYEKLRVIGTAPTRLLIVSDALEELYTHQLDKRTVPCTLTTGKCWLDHQLVGKERYNGWLAVVVQGLRGVRLVCLTAIAVGVEPRLRNRSMMLRGLTLDVWRLHGHERSEMRCQLRLEEPIPSDIPPAPDVRFCVERMLEAENRADKLNRDERTRATSLGKILAAGGAQ